MSNKVITPLQTKFGSISLGLYHTTCLGHSVMTLKAGLIRVAYDHAVCYELKLRLFNAATN